MSLPGHWVIGSHNFRDHCIVVERREPITKKRGVILQKNGYVVHITAKNLKIRKIWYCLHVRCIQFRSFPFN